MKLVCTKPNGYRGAAGARSYGEVFDLPEDEARTLLMADPGAFVPAPAVEDVEGETKALDAPPRSKPVRVRKVK